MQPTMCQYQRSELLRRASRAPRWEATIIALCRLLSERCRISRNPPPRDGAPSYIFQDQLADLPERGKAKLENGPFRRVLNEADRFLGKFCEVHGAWSWSLCCVDKDSAVRLHGTSQARQARGVAMCAKWAERRRPTGTFCGPSQGVHGASSNAKPADSACTAQVFLCCGFDYAAASAMILAPHRLKNGVESVSRR